MRDGLLVRQAEAGRDRVAEESALLGGAQLDDLGDHLEMARRNGELLESGENFAALALG